MSIDVDVLVEAYTILKQYIPAKERQEAADNLAGMLNDAISETEFKEFGMVDNYAHRAVGQYMDEDYQDYGDYEE